MECSIHFSGVVPSYHRYTNGFYANWEIHHSSTKFTNHMRLKTWTRSHIGKAALQKLISVVRESSNIPGKRILCTSSTIPHAAGIVDGRIVLSTNVPTKKCKTFAWIESSTCSQSVTNTPRNKSQTYCLHLDKNTSTMIAQMKKFKNWKWKFVGRQYDRGRCWRGGRCGSAGLATQKYWKLQKSRTFGFLKWTRVADGSFEKGWKKKQPGIMKSCLNAISTKELTQNNYGGKIFLGACLDIGSERTVRGLKQARENANSPKWHSYLAHQHFCSNLAIHFENAWEE